MSESREPEVELKGAEVNRAGSPPPSAATDNRAAVRTDKRHTRGTHRVLSVERSLLNAHRVAERVGISRVANVTGLDNVGLPVVAVYRPNARSLVVSQGKGLDLNAATVSGMMEAIESHCAEHVELPLRLASARELAKRARVVELAALPRRSHHGADLDRPMLFSEALELATGEAVFVPYELVHTNFSLPLPTGSGAFLMSSNGLASGNHKLEAISHGLCELIERDAMALFRAEGGVARQDRRIDPSRIADVDCRRVIALIEAADLACGIWEVTSDVGIAAFACVIVDRTENLFRQLYFATGSGCHPCREVALLRALTEAAQCRLTYIAGARDDGDREFFEHARNRDRVESMRRCIDVPLDRARTFASVPTRNFNSIEDDVRWEVERLTAVGLGQVLVVDLSVAELDIPVARVIVPGLESISSAPGYLPGPRALRVTQS